MLGNAVILDFSYYVIRACKAAECAISRSEALVSPPSTAKMWWSLVTLLSASGAVAWWWWWRHRRGHFQRLGLAFVEPLPLFGSMLPLALRKKTLAELVLDVYDGLRGHDYGGFFFFTRPLVVVRDPALIRQVFVKDFDHFTDHLVVVSERADPLFGKNLLSLTGQRWRDMRATLSPAFTSSKLKHMLSLISQICRQMTQHLEATTSTAPDQVHTLDVKELFTRVTNDVIASTAFGVDVDSLNNRENRFYRMGQEITNLAGPRSLGHFLVPKVMELLGVSLLRPKLRKFFVDLVEETMRVRERDGSVRRDMIHLLMQARRGELRGDDDDDDDDKAKQTTPKKKPLKLDDDDVAAQVIVFFVAGFETVSILMCFCAYFLATNPDVQTRLLKEVDATMADSDGEPTYGQVQAMNYMDMFISECLRMYSPVPATDRRCVRSYRLPATTAKDPAGVLLRPGDVVWAPIHALHHDPQYFPRPEVFDPERFNPENRGALTPGTYYPFGIGPRACIGMRLALLETKAVLLHLLSKFSVEAVPQTPVPLKLSGKDSNLGIEGGFVVGLRRRQQSSSSS